MLVLVEVQRRVHVTIAEACAHILRYLAVLRKHTLLITSPSTLAMARAVC